MQFSEKSDSAAQLRNLCPKPRFRWRTFIIKQFELSVVRPHTCSPCLRQTAPKCEMFRSDFKPDYEFDILLLQPALYGPAYATARDAVSTSASRNCIEYRRAYNPSCRISSS